MGIEDERNSGPRETSGYGGPEDQWVQRTRGTVGTQDQRTVGTED